METNYFYWKIGIFLAATLLVAFRIAWFLRRQKSWELLGIALIFTALSAVNLAQNNSFLNLGHIFLTTTSILLVLLALEPEIGWLLHHLFKHTTPGQKTNRQAIDEILTGSQILSHAKTGALIAFERSDSLSKLSQSGTVVNSDVKRELLTALFSKDSMTHDGGVIIRNGRIAYCSVIFPLTFDSTIDKNLGTRHRAAIGLTELTDAICLVVSEEEGTISLAKEGKIFYNLDPKTLHKDLTHWLAERPAKRIYPLHRLRSLALRENSTVALRFLKSFSLQLYDLVFLLFWILTIGSTIFAQGKTVTQQSLIEFFSLPTLFQNPLLWVSAALAGIHLIFLLIQFEMIFNRAENRFAKKTSFLFLPLRKIKRSFDELNRILVKREGQKAFLWSLRLEDKKKKIISLDAGGFPNRLLAAAKLIHEFVRIELINQS